MQTVQSPSRQINHKVMRVIVGAIAVLLSPMVWFLSGNETELTSISISYWTDSRDIFVGSLVIVGFFLSAYNGAGNGRDREYYLSKFACFFAICVAVFPTTGFSKLDIPSSWVLAISETIGVASKSIHNASAILLFTCLIALMWFFSVRAKAKGRPERAYFYRGISVLMVVGIVGLSMIGSLFWAELWGLTFFGLGWLVAGCYKSNDQPKTTEG